MRLIVLLSLFYSLVPIFASHAFTNTTVPERIFEQQPDLKPLGSARYSKFGFKLYDAELWASNTKTTPESLNGDYALSLIYKRDIEKSRLIKATDKEWRRLGVSDSQRTAWIATLESIWPDVQKGSVLTSHIVANNKTVFYLGDTKLGEVNDSNFGSAFLDIWLSEKSQFKKQRNLLLGASNE